MNKQYVEGHCGHTYVKMKPNKHSDLDQGTTEQQGHDSTQGTTEQQEPDFT
jgi:hypothetical protein